jgi:hypothetical protein
MKFGKSWKKVSCDTGHLKFDRAGYMETIQMIARFNFGQTLVRRLIR